MDLLKHIVELWLQQLEAAEKAKEKQFGMAARQAWQYLGRDYQPLYYEAEHEFPDAEEGLSKPVIVGKSAEFVALMLPYIHAKVPHRLVSPSRPPLTPKLMQILGGEVAKHRQLLDSQDSIRAWQLEFWLNYITREGYDLAQEVRCALPEVLVKGAAVLWTELTEGPYGLMPASFYDSIDSLYIDPDTERLQDAAFIIRKRRMSVWRIAERFGIDPETLRGQYDSNLQRSIVASSGAPASEEGDVGEYYEIWSRMGIGHKLVDASDELKDARGQMDALGQHVYLAVMRGVPHPLNLPPHIIEQEDWADELKTRMAWPIAFFEEISDPWPCSVVQFYPNSHNPWAQSPLAGGLQCQIFLDKLYYFMMRRVRSTCRDIIVTSETLSEAVKKAIESGRDLEMVDVAGEPGIDLSKLIEILEFPPVNKDLWSMVQLVERQFERATGMTPLLSGAQPDSTPRSATDVRAREGHITSRPDDFADLVEAWSSRIAAKEAQATRLYIEPPYELFGEAGPNAEGQLPPESILSAAWTKLVMTEDPVVAASELSYTVEAGSGRRRNKQKQAADAAQLMQVLSQPYLQYGFTTGRFEPFNNLIQKLGEAQDIPLDNVGLPNIPMQPVPPEATQSSNTK